jgi:hypothetical protein
MVPRDPTPEPHDSEPSAAPAGTPIEAGHGAFAGAQPFASMPRRPERIWALAVGAGLLAGVMSWVAGEAALTAFKPELEEAHGMGVVLLLPSRKGEIKADTQNAALAFGLLGAILGLGLGITGGLVPEAIRIRRGAIAALTGLAVGGALGVGASLALVPVFNQARMANPLSLDLTIPMLVHAGIWAAVGAGGGLAFGLGLGGDRRRIARATIGGLVGGALAAVAYEMIGALVFPLADTPRPLSLTWGTRLLARLLVTTLAAAGAAALVTFESSRRLSAHPESNPGIKWRG